MTSATSIRDNSDASKYRRCTRCLMDTTDPEIEFDDQGQCNHCRLFFERRAREVVRGEAGQAELQRIAEKIRDEGRGKPYDCIMGVSGGVDSSMVAYVAKEVMGLRPLAVHLDNGWNSELAVDNINRLLDRLGVDLHTHVIDWDEFRDVQKSFIRAGVPNLEVPTDHAILALLYRSAASFGVRHILSGSNLATEGIQPALAWGYYHQDRRHLLGIHRRFGTHPVRTLPTIGLPRLVFDTFIRRMKWVKVLNYIDYSRHDAIRLLVDEMGWRPYPGKHYESVFTRFFQGYILPERFGYDKRKAHLSTLVCDGQLTREEALAELERDPYSGLDREADQAFFRKKLGFSEAEFDEMIAAAPRTYRDYPSNAFFFLGMRRLKGKFKDMATRI